jgi:hypothetical protein
VGRFTQSLCAKGSQRWLQKIVNDAPDLFDEQIGVGHIDWRSPLMDDDYAEYRDDEFLERVGVKASKKALNLFWPRGGPQWDGLGVADSGEVILVEAKAHLNELYSPACAASDSSLARIQLALREAAHGLGVPDGFEWSKQFYQYANRLAHAYFLNTVNQVPTKLVFVYFVGDIDVRGPATRAEWESAVDAAHQALGLARTPPFVVDVFIDVTQVPQAA